MNKYIEAVKALDHGSAAAMIKEDPKWIGWSESGQERIALYVRVSES